jgi:hypothetical protein
LYQKDHVLLSLLYEVLDGLPTAETIKQPRVLDWVLNEWLEGRGDPLATSVKKTAFLSHSSILLDSARTDELAIIMKELSLKSTSGKQDKQFDLQKQVSYRCM